MITKLVKHALRGMILALLCLIPAQALADVEGVVRYGISGTSLQYEFFEKDDNNHQSYTERNYRPVRLTGYVDGSDVRYFTRWVPNNGTAWRSRFGKTGADFDDINLTYRNQGFYLVDVSGYQTPNGIRYAGIWYENTGNISWTTHRHITYDEMQELADTIGENGWRPQRVEGYANGSQSRFISVWYHDPGTGYRWHSKMTRETYQDKLDTYQAAGIKIVRIHAHTVGGEVYYSGIWKPATATPRVRSNRRGAIFQRFYNNYWADGYNIDDFYAAETPAGVRFGGIWYYDGVPDDSTLYKRVRKVVDGAPALGGAAVLNLTTGEDFSIHGDRTFAIASTSKIGILYALLKEIQAGTGITWTTEINSGAQFGNNQGNWLQANTDYLVSDMAGYMIRSSNNWATNRLIELIGRDKINQHLENLGLEVTRIHRYMTGTGAPSAHGLSSAGADRNAGYENLSTPNEMVELLRRVHLTRVLNRTNKGRFWNTLEMDGNNDGVNTKSYFAGAVTPLFNPIIQVYNKAGDLGSAGNDSRHVHADAGRFVFPDAQVVFLAVFMDYVSDDPDEMESATQTAIDNAKQAIRDAAKQVANQFY